MLEAVIFGAGNRVKSRISPVLTDLGWKITLVTRTRASHNTVPGVAEYFLFDEFDFSNEPELAIVASSHESKFGILSLIQDAGWSCPVLIDTPLGGLERFSEFDNFFALEESFLIDHLFRASDGEFIASNPVAAENIFIFGALPLGHGLPALSNWFGDGNPPVKSQVVFSVFGFFVYPSTRILWFFRKTSFRFVIYLGRPEGVLSVLVRWRRRSHDGAIRQFFLPKSVLGKFEEHPVSKILEFYTSKELALHEALTSISGANCKLPALGKAMRLEKLVLGSRRGFRH